MHPRIIFMILKCGRAACIYEIAFPVAAVLRSIFCHNMYRQTSIPANNMGLSELLLLLLDSHTNPHPYKTHTKCTHTHPHTHKIRHLAVPVIMCGMNTTGCGSTLAIYRQTHCPLLFCLHTMATPQDKCVTNKWRYAKK